MHAFDDGEVSCVMENSEKAIYFSKFFLTRKYYDSFLGKEVEKGVTFVIKDSFKFLGSSIDKLAKTLDEEDWKGFREEYGENWEFLTNNLPFPYTFLNGQKCLLQEGLPSIEEFGSNLGEGEVIEEAISEEEYGLAKKVFEAFECKTFGDYVKIYCRSDIDILSFVFEKLIEQSMKEYGVDPSQCYTSPGFFWEAMLRSTKVEVELLTDPEMFRFFESAIRGGISVVPGRCADANNYLLEDYDPSKPSSFIEDLDKNGLYCTVMHYPLPIRGFRWLGAEEVKELCYQLGRRESLPANKGALLCVDLELPTVIARVAFGVPSALRESYCEWSS